MTLDDVDVVFPSPAPIPIHNHRNVSERKLCDGDGGNSDFFSHDTVQNSFQENK